MRRLGCVLLVTLVVLLGAPPVEAEATYAPPVDGPIVDRFRPPLTRFGSGNRGVDFDAARGTEVRAAADGEVVFAGPVGGTHHVVVLHPDGLRTSYSFLALSTVDRGDRVSRGDVVGAAGGPLHFGVRAGDDRYLDPEALLEGEAPEVHLVPLEERGPLSESGERRNLLQSLAGFAGASVRAVAGGVEWARGEAMEVWDLAWAEAVATLTALRVLVYYANVPKRMAELAARARLLLASQEDCTPKGTPPRRRPSGRRIALLVGGLGSAAGEASVLDVDTAALGYAPGDVGQFSYRGGQAPGPRTIAGIDVTTYGPEDSTGDIRVAGEHLRSLLESIRMAHPGVPVDVIAHSQGGLVTRAALGEDVDHLDPRLPPIGHVITLGTPHHGADIATLNVALGSSMPGQLVQEGVRRLSDGGVDPLAVATAQLAETSRLLDELADRPLPAGAHVTSIAARGDVVAPALSSSLPGATNVMVAVDGISAHAELPGSPEAAREMALALAGQPPTCRNLLGDLFLAAGISLAQDGIGGAISVGSHLTRVGRAASPGPLPPR